VQDCTTDAGNEQVVVMAQRKTGRSRWLSAVAFVVVLVATTAVVGVAYVRHREISPDDVDCTHAKCVAMTFDDGPTPFDWINDANTAASRYMLMTQIKPGSVVLLHDTYSSTVDLVEQFIPVLKANGYHLVTVGHLIGPRDPGSSYGSRVNGPPANDLTDIPAAQIPTLPVTPSPKPAPNLPITDIRGQNPGGPQ